LQQQPLQPGTEQSWRPAFLLSSQALLDLILALTGKNMQYLLDQWVTQPPATLRLRPASQLIRSATSSHWKIRDDPPVAASGGGGGGGGRRRRYTGAVAVSLQELDGPFTHTLKLDESAAVSDLPFAKLSVAKCLLSNGDELEDPDLGKLESDCSLLWLRVDPEMQLIRHVEIVQPEPMWHLLLRYERCVASQMAACRALCQPCFHSRETWQALMETCWKPLMAVFLSLFRWPKDTRSVTPRERFLKSPTLFPIERGASVHVAALHTAQGVCPPEVPEFILNLLRFNDNSKNIYADDYYRGRAHRVTVSNALVLAATVTTGEFPGQAAEAYCCAAGGSAPATSRRDISAYSKATRLPANYIDVRLAAMEAVVNHIKCAKDALRWPGCWTLHRRFCAGSEASWTRLSWLSASGVWLNTELSADCRSAASVASLLPLAVRQAPPKCTPLPENFLVLNVREGRTKIAQRAPTPPPAPADTDDDNANFWPHWRPASGDEADVDDDLDIGLEDDYDFPAADGRCPAAPAVARAPPLPLRRRLTKRCWTMGIEKRLRMTKMRYSATAGTTCLTAELLDSWHLLVRTGPTMSSELQSSHWYQFWHSIDCNSTARWEPLREPSFLAFLCAADAPSACCACSACCSTLCPTWPSAGTASDSTLAMQLRSLAVTDVIYVLANTIDNFCHTLETLPAPAGDSRLFLLPIFGHPIVWGIRVAFITPAQLADALHGRRPLRQDPLATARQPLVQPAPHRQLDGRHLDVAMATSLVRGLEVTSVLADCPDGFNRMAVVASRIFPAYTMAVNFGLQTVTPVVAVMVVNVLLLRTVRRSNNFQRDAAGGGSSPNSTIAVSTVSAWPAAVERGQLAASSSDRGVPSRSPPTCTSSLTLVGNVDLSSMDGTCNFFIYVVTNPKFKRG
uniref:PNPLA domain-containing protein n=1 Tax=Macrostomum lignano TaxID=282301 RepID=A0A1I8FQ28_9PLAT